MADTSYEINFTEAANAANILNEKIDSLSSKIKELETVRIELLSDNNWQGPNKSKFVEEFDKYCASLEDLHKNAQTYYQSLSEIIQKYSDAEQQ